MGDNIDAAKYVILSVLFQFLGLVSMVDAISLSYIDAICSSTLLIRGISLFVIYLVMIYKLIMRIILYVNLLTYSTVNSRFFIYLSHLATVHRLVRVANNNMCLHCTPEKKPVCSICPASYIAACMQL